MPTQAHTRGVFGRFMSALSLALLIAGSSMLDHGAAKSAAPANAAVRAPALVTLPAPAAAPGGTFQDFDVPNMGTPYVVDKHLLPTSPGPIVIDGGPTGSGKMLRLAFGSATTPITNHNSIAFERADPGASAQVVADFDFRITPRSGRADGMGFALLNTAHYNITGTVAPHLPPYAAEEPNFTGSLGIGFDVYWTESLQDINNNHISIHFNGTRVQEFDATPALDLGGSQWAHARVIMRPGGGHSDVTVILGQCGRPPVTVVDRFKVPGFTPYEGRTYFAARSGGLTSDQDIDNVHVQSLSLTQNVLAFRTGCASVLESDGQLQLTVERASSSGGAATVKFATSDTGLTAKAGLDYTTTTGTLTFGPNELTKTVSIPIRNDALNEGDEHFQVSLSDATGGAVLGGPAIANVTIVDDEAARPVGHWSEPIPSQVVPIHMHVLPTGQVMYWDRHDDSGGLDGDPRLWDPATGIIRSTGVLTYDIFCAGHSFLEDGRLLVTGGHIPLKDPDSGVGEDEASIYDPSTNTWERLPTMNAGRWYPSNVTLADGDVLVVGGTYLTSTAVFTPALEPLLNRIPQVFDTASKTWRALSTAEQGFQPQWADYYPFLYVAPDGKIFNAGPQRVARYLDTSGTGKWTDVATSTGLLYRDYGSSVMYDEGKVLIAGGSLRNDIFTPTASVEVIDLKAAKPAWKTVAPMHFARRQLNTTLLPDGTVLATGGSSKPGFDEPTGAVLQAELWNPKTEQWSIMAAQTRYRGYHSTAALLPDGRVLVGGGGHPDPMGGSAQANFEIFSPPYLFKGPRPRITNVLQQVAYNRKYLVETPDAASIASVSLIRLSSVTHSFNQNQRINKLTFIKATNGLTITTPISPTQAPPGHYMLFIVNAQGVPSVAKIIQLGLTVAADDSYGASINTILRVPAPGVLGNDGDANMHPLTLLINTLPTSGTLVLKSDGSFTYTPTKNPIGSDSFTYTVNNGHGRTDTATVHILEHRVYLSLLRR